MIINGFDEADPERLEFVVIGAGPVGLSVALSLVRRGKKVHLLEAGGAAPRSDRSGVFDFVVADPGVHAAADLVCRQGLGGTSSAWGACCVPLDPLDCDSRRHIPHSGFPLPHSEISSRYDAAAKLVGITNSFVDGAGDVDPDPEVDWAQLMRYGNTPNLALRHRAEIEHSELLRLHLDTRLVSLKLRPGEDRVERLTIESAGRRREIKVGRALLCCGGIQSARVLLLLQREHPGFLGGERGPLGRYYAGHVSGSVARIRFDRPRTAARFVARKDADGSFVRGCFTFRREAQEKNRLLNHYFALNNLPLGDPAYRNGAFSAIHLGLSLRHGTARYMSRYHPGHIETEYEFGVDPIRHLANIAANPIRTVRGLTEVIRTRAAHERSQPFFSFYNPAGCYALRYHSEQMPDPESRVTLSDRCDDTGTPLPHVCLRVSDQDVQSVIRSHVALEERLRARGDGGLEWHHPPEHRAAHVRAQASDGYHQIGLTRMSRSPARGVVDKDLRVHGVSNLFIVSAGVLPTGGRAHPTFPTIALGIRLTDVMTRQYQVIGA